MLILLSPAKILNFKPQTIISDFTIPEFSKEAKELIRLLQNLTSYELGRLLDINNKLTQINFDRIFNYHYPFTPQNAKQAVLTYDGEVFRGLNAKTFSENDFEYAQKHLR